MHNCKINNKKEDKAFGYKTEINYLQKQINKKGNEIDKIVYELYELTAEEIKIVEVVLNKT